MTSWQTRIYLRLRDRGWHQIGALFEEIQTEIPLHVAMRAAMNPARGRTELPSIPEARWRKFLSCLSAIGIETSGSRFRFKWQDEVRLRYLEGRTCEDCGGPVIKASWATGREGTKGAHPAQTACLACEAAAAPPTPIVTEIEIVLPRLPLPGDRIGDAVAYAVLHRLISYWGPPMMQHQARPPRSQSAAARAPPVTYFWPKKPRQLSRKS